jgi:hypothetical protein
MRSASLPSVVLEPRVRTAHEQGLVEQLVAHEATEALDLAILHRLARSDVIATPRRPARTMRARD